MRRTIILLLAVMVTITIHGQNRLDEQGRKTGPWKGETSDGKVLYEGTFQEGKPVGLMVRYYESGAVQARMMFDPGGECSRAKLFYKNGKQAAEGLYVQKAKDSVWIYYSEFDGTVRIRETYSAGKLHGKTIRYYPSGDVSEEVTWDQDSREGPWNQYFEDGTVRLKGHYSNNMLNGPYEVYFGDGTLIMSGVYLNDESNGSWSYFDETGNLLYTLEYKNGKPVDQEKYLKLLQEHLLPLDTIPVPQPFQQ